MIYLGEYSEEVKKKYYKSILHEKLDKSRRIKNKDKFIKDLRKYVGCDDIKDMEDLILMPFDRMKKIKNCFDSSGNKRASKSNQTRTAWEQQLNTYKNYFDAMRSVKIEGLGIYKYLIDKLSVNVCPYCNRDYINTRGNKSNAHMTAQMDHFFDKDHYPFFALSIYNLVPSCFACNNVKSNQNATFESPFNPKANWDSIRFLLKGKGLFEKTEEIEINTVDGAINNNLNAMKIQSAYQIHTNEIDNLKEIIIAHEGCKNEFQKVLDDKKITNLDIDKLLFGPRLTNDNIKNVPIGRMKKYLLEHYNVWK